MSSYLKTGQFTFDYNVPSAVSESGEFNVSLSFHSGFTGTVQGAITGVGILNSGSGYFYPPILKISGGSDSDASVSLLVNSTGEITGVNLLDCGSGHNQVSFTLYQNISEFQITSDGHGYFSEPMVQVSSPVGDIFSGAVTGDQTIDSSVSSGKLNAIKLYDGFEPTGYINVPTVTFKECVSGVKIISRGTGYANEDYPAFVFSGGGGNFASGSGLLGGLVTGVTIVSMGSGYTGSQPPEFYFTGNRLDGFGAARASGMLGSGALTGVKMLSWGGGWLETPRIELESYEHNFPGLYAPLVIPEMAYSITGFDMISHGRGYSESPGLLSSHGDGLFEVIMSSGASAKAVLSSGLYLGFETGSFEKSFSGTWNLMTGDFSSDYRSQNLYEVPCGALDGWLDDETYQTEDTACYDDRVYESLRDSNLNHNPSYVSNQGVWWEDKTTGEFRYFNPTEVTVPTGLSVVPVAVTHTAQFEELESVVVLNFSGSGISPENIYITGKR